MDRPIIYISFSVTSVLACSTATPLNLEDAAFADTVVVGKIRNYKIIKNLRVRQQRKEYLDRNPDLKQRNPDIYKMFSEQRSFLSDYARFEIAVEEVLFGQSSKLISVTWNNSTFGEPKNVSDEPYLVALRNSTSQRPPLRGLSATILPNPEPQLMTVLQAPCSGAFFLKSSGEQAKKVKQLLNSASE